MAKLLRALIVEDAEDDALLLLRELRRGGYEPEFARVETAETLRAAFAERNWEIVLSDWSMPHFSAREAFVVTRQMDQNIPFIIVSGTIGEDTAVEAMRTGVNDFFVKGRLARLIPAIERELRESEARRSRAAMEQELHREQRQSLRLERAREQAQRESDFKSKFLANMSHELRTPLNAIIGFSELLQQEIPDPLTLTQKEYVESVAQSGQHLLRLIDDILDLSKIDAGRLELQRERMSLASGVAAVRAAVRTLAVKRGVQLDLVVPPDLPDIDADPMRLKQILYNLLSNAIKFTSAGGSVRLTAYANSRYVHVSVIDTGIGIAAADIARLFSEFERIESPTGEKTQGTGLGLALTRRLVMLHGGSISVESEPGRGSTFSVTLPLHGGAPQTRGES